MDAVDTLVVDPRPPTSFPFGSPDERPLHVGRYRVMYRIHEDTISVWWVGRVGDAHRADRLSTRQRSARTGTATSRDGQTPGWATG